MPYTGVTSLAAKHPSFPWAGIKRATFTDFVEKVELLSREIAIQVCNHVAKYVSCFCCPVYRMHVW